VTVAMPLAVPLVVSVGAVGAVGAVTVGAVGAADAVDAVGVGAKGKKTNWEWEKHAAKDTKGTDCVKSIIVGGSAEH
jgi:TRAP-type mannitol/chloroaromatic compound transport system permease large subunit